MRGVLPTVGQQGSDHHGRSEGFADVRDELELVGNGEEGTAELAVGQRVVLAGVDLLADLQAFLDQFVILECLEARGATACARHGGLGSALQQFLELLLGFVEHCSLLFVTLGHDVVHGQVSCEGTLLKGQEKTLKYSYIIIAYLFKKSII